MLNRDLVMRVFAGRIEGRSVGWHAREVILSILLAMGISGSAQAQGTAITLDGLTEGSRIASFHATARYRMGEAGSLGARFVHGPTGMPVDILRFDSVPQAMVWVRTAPISDRGEPHTLEHLVLGKGIKGRLYALGLDMSLGSNSAGTWRDKTLYHFHTAGGEESFSENLFHMLDTLIDPDFTDEEVRREVAHLSVVEDEATGRLSLEEKGTVYLEMISSFEKPGSVIWSEIRRRIYGPNHPLGMESGGRPDAIREMTPENIREFHRRRYRPGSGMGLIVGLPPQIPLDRFLETLDGMMQTILGENPVPGPTNDSVAEIPLEPQEPVIRVLPFPSASVAERSSAILAWPPHEGGTLSDLFGLQVLWYLVSGDQASYLHKDLIDSRTRKGPAGVTSVEGWIEMMHGHPPMIWLDGMNPSLAQTDSLLVIRDLIKDRLAWIAHLEPGSNELAELNERARTYLVAQKRELLRQVEAPPRFGYRGTGDFWYIQLREQQRQPGFEKDLILEGDRNALVAELDTGNIWTRLIEKNGLLGDPFCVAARPDTNLSAEQAKAKRERLAASVEAMKVRYSVTDAQEALRMGKAEFDAKTAELEAIEKTIPQPPLLPDPPMTLDDGIESSVQELSSPIYADRERPTIPLCLNGFDRTSMIDAGLYYDLTQTQEDRLLYLAILPVLITDLGCWDDDSTWIEYGELTQRLQRDLYAISARPSAFMRADRGRVELAVTGTGLGIEEGKTALLWIERLLTSATRIDSIALGRLRDLVDQEIGSTRQRMMGAEENWARNPAEAYRYQKDRVYLSTVSIFTRLHHLNRLAWRLREPPSPQVLAWLNGELANIAGRAGSSRDDLRAELDRLGENADADEIPGEQLLKAVAEYLKGALDEVPDGTLTADFRKLSEQVVADLGFSPRDVTSDLNDFVRGLLYAGPDRAHLTGNKKGLAAIEPDLRRLVDRLGRLDPPRIRTRPEAEGGRSSRGVITANLTERDAKLGAYLAEAGRDRMPYVALPLESTRNALFMNSRPLLEYGEAQRSELVDFLAAKIYGGGGAHGVFMKTWGAGLAYSNGIGAGARSGLVSYYAERCSDGVETLRFVGDVLEQADSTLEGSFYLDYALANAFADYRGGSTYISRGRAMANDWADGVTPDRVRRFKSLLMQMRKEWSGPDRSVDAEPVSSGRELISQIQGRLPHVLGPILVGYGEDVGEEKDVVGFMIGPNDQITHFENYVESHEPELPVARLYPRDYWID